MLTFTKDALRIIEAGLKALDLPPIKNMPYFDGDVHVLECQDGRLHLNLELEDRTIRLLSSQERDRDAMMPKWYRKRFGYRYEGYDLGPTSEDARAGRGTRKDWDNAYEVLRRSWDVASRRYSEEERVRYQIKPSSLLDGAQA